MSKVDPVGIQATLATIQPGQLSERQQRIAAGLAMIANGSSILAAAREVELPDTTLGRYARGIANLTNENDGGRGADLEALHDAAIDNALIAANMMKRSMLHQPDDWKPADLVKAFGVSTDKVVVLNQRTAAPASGITELVGALLDQADLVLKKRDTSADAIEVAAEIG